MCLTVDFRKTIDDEKVYTFYKKYKKQGNKYFSPFQLTKKPEEGKTIIARHKGKPIPADGAKAYAINSGHIRETFQKVNEGIHAYVYFSKAKRSIYWSYSSLVEIHVKGKHIMAFGQDGDVVFTRGIIGRIVK